MRSPGFLRRNARGGGTAWLIAAGAGLCALALPAIVALLLWGGADALWPARLAEVSTQEGKRVLGEVVAVPGDASSHWLLRTAVIGGHGRYERIAAADIIAVAWPHDAVRLHSSGGDQHYFAAPTQTKSDDGTIVERANAAGLLDRVRESLRRLWRLISDDPAAGNAAGGLWPALVGTVVLVFLMTLLVTPLGVCAALYLYEYARPGRMTRLLRAAVYQLAGIPSIVVGMFALGFFVHTLGGGLDAWLYGDVLPQPTFGAGGLLWAALTLAILTLPVVIVATEEGLARVPQSVRLGSLALGATQSETLWYQILPIARPALLTGVILAIARAAGEVAPLMLVGVVKLAPALPLDAQAPFLHPSRQFMHLGQQVYDTALNHPDPMLGAPRAYLCALLLLAVVLALNLAASTVRQRLRERYRALENAGA